MRARTGNAMAVVQLRAGRDEAATWSATGPLQEQLPELTPMLRDALTALR